MKRYRHGFSHGISTDSLAFVEVRPSNFNRPAKPMTTLISLDARIATDLEGFRMRFQQWIMLEPAIHDDLSMLINFVKICAHIRNLTSNISHLVVKERGSQYITLEHPVTTEVHRYDSCCTDFQAEL